MQPFAFRGPIAAQVGFGRTAILPGAAVERAIPGAGLEIPAGRDDFGLQGVIPLPGDLTKIGGPARTNEGLQLHVPALAKDLDLEVAAAGSSNSVVRCPAGGRRAGVVSLENGEAPPPHIRKDFSDRFVVLNNLKPVGTELSWLGGPGCNCRRRPFESVDPAACFSGVSRLEMPACDVEHCRNEQFLALYAQFSEGDLGCMPQQPGCLVIQRLGAFLEGSNLEDHRELTALFSEAGTRGNRPPIFRPARYLCARIHKPAFKPSDGGWLQCA